MALSFLTRGLTMVAEEKLEAGMIQHEYLLVVLVRRDKRNMRCWSE